MPTAHYITWTDAREHLDRQIHTEGSLHVDILTNLCLEAETRFDARLVNRYEVPFTEAASPEAYFVAKRVCSRWAAAQYDRHQREAQTIGPGEMTWAERLEREAEDFLGLLETRRGPADATENASGVVYRPDDGYTAATAPPALFTRSQITPDSPSHW